MTKLVNFWRKSKYVLDQGHRRVLSGGGVKKSGSLNGRGKEWFIMCKGKETEAVIFL